MPTPQQILEDQVVQVKAGRLRSQGFEPLFNSFYDYYLSSRYIDPPLLQFEDVTLLLYLRKNINDRNPAWRMPTFKQMIKKFRMGQHRIEGMMKRLSDAKLLEKISGYQKGENSENIPNHYIISDPVQTLDEFLLLAANGVFGRELLPQWKEYIEGYSRDGYRVYSDELQPLIAETAISNILPNKKQDSELDILWSSVLDTLRLQLPASTFNSFLENTQLLELCDGVATVTLANSKAKDWIENRLARQLKQLLSIEGKTQVDTLHIEIQS